MCHRKDREEEEEEEEEEEVRPKVIQNEIPVGGMDVEQ